jgi:carboxyl-terminal processing protease
MYLKPDTGFRPDPYEFVTIGIQFFQVDAESFTVAAVWKPSPAYSAGIVVGDRIVSVNGRPSAELGLDAFADQLHGAPGTSVAIEVERNAGKFLLGLKTRELVCGSPAL